MSAQQNRFDSLRALAHQHIASGHVYPDEESLYRQTHDRAESAYIAAATPTTILALLDALDAALTPAASDGKNWYGSTMERAGAAARHAPTPDDRDREHESHDLGPDCPDPIEHVGPQSDEQVAAAVRTVRTALDDRDREVERIARALPGEVQPFTTESGLTLDGMLLVGNRESIAATIVENLRLDAGLRASGGNE